MTTAALIVAAGRGSRAAVNGGPPKQYMPLAGRPVVMHAIAPFATHPAVDLTRVIIHSDDAHLYDAATRGFAGRLGNPVRGGPSRQDSVRLGLEALAGDAPDLVLIHDAVRPLVESCVISRVVAALDRHTGAIAAEPLADTLKKARGDGTIASTIDRTGLWRAQTPQGFRFAPMLAAHRRAASQGCSEFTDDAALAEWAGLDVALVEGSSRNIKLTTAQDIALAQRLLAAEPAAYEGRTGTGFDVHRFGPGDHVWLAGVRIAHDRGLEGHSDADVPLHALTDAILGALGDGDIGEHFPPTDAKWKGVASRVFVLDAGARVAARNGRISNVDVTILAEAPRIGPHRRAMQLMIAEMLALDPARVGVKATTTEGLGFLGRREGIAAIASATILLPA